MKKAIIILLLCIPVVANAANYYVATNGNDNNPGTLEQPWATWQKGFNSISPGDILYIRGGTYYPGATVSLSSYNGVIINGKNGTSSANYQVFNYPGEVPVLDCRNMTGTSYGRTAIYINSSSYWHLKGLSVTRADQSSSPIHGGGGIEIYYSHHNLIENCKAYANGGPGFLCKTQTGNENNFLNCDSYYNYDPYSGLPGDNADGFAFGYLSGDYIVRVTGCRSWSNSDDGYDCYQGTGYSGKVYFTDSWSWNNGYIPGTTTTAGQGCGFKLGLDGQAYDGVTRRFLYNCVAYNNRTRGFSQEAANVKKEFYNCIAYSNEMHGFSFWALDIPDILKNNVSFDNAGSQIEQLGTKRISNNNSWDGGVTVTAADFASLDGKELERSRKADGSLPDISFLHLAAGSDLIDKGVDAGIPFSGTAPDLGAFEQQTSSVSTAPKITMTISPNPVHKNINILFAYASTFSKLDPMASPQIIRILDMFGKLFIEKLLVTGITSFKFPINLKSGMYNVILLSGGLDIYSQKIIVYK